MEYKVGYEAVVTIVSHSTQVGMQYLYSDQIFIRMRESKRKFWKLFKKLFFKLFSAYSFYCSFGDLRRNLPILFRCWSPNPTIFFVVSNQSTFGYFSLKMQVPAYTCIGINILIFCLKGHTLGCLLGFTMCGPHFIKPYGYINFFLGSL